MLTIMIMFLIIIIRRRIIIIKLIIMKSELRIGYLNDISIAGHTQTVTADLILLMEAACKLERQLNTSKCYIFPDGYIVTRTMKIFEKNYRMSRCYWVHQFSKARPLMKRSKEPYPD